MSNKPLGGKQYFEFSEEQRLSWLRLYRSQNVGPKTFRDLISYFGTAQAALEALPDLAERGGAASKIRIFALRDAEKELYAAKKFGARFIALGEPDYPSALRASDHSPPILCTKGNTDVLHPPAIAVVGSRNASITSLRLTERLTRELGEAGYIIVSGLARGIDTAAHKASIATGTIAVFAGGLDRIFPEENIELSENIYEHQGLLMSEMPMGWQPRAQDFPRRNRIVSGLAKAVLVVEAAKRSGSLITARFANETGRLVLAVPGSPLDPRSDGTNSLIREGATLIRSADDVIEAVEPLGGETEEFVFDIREPEYGAQGSAGEQNFSNEANPAEPPQSIRDAILSALGPSPAEIDDIIHYCNASPGTVQLLLLELALAGRIEHHPGNRVSLIE